MANKRYGPYTDKDGSPSYKEVLLSNGSIVGIPEGEAILETKDGWTRLSVEDAAKKPRAPRKPAAKPAASSSSSSKAKS